MKNNLFILIQEEANKLLKEGYMRHEVVKGTKTLRNGRVKECKIKMSDVIEIIDSPIFGINFITEDSCYTVARVDYDIIRNRASRLKYKI